MSRQFSVYQYFRDDTHMRMLAYVDHHTAMRKAAELIRGTGAYLGTIRRIIVTDGGDHIVFEWQYSHGITWPPKESHDARRQAT